MTHAGWKNRCSAIGRPSSMRCQRLRILCPLTNPWRAPSASPPKKLGTKWTLAGANSTPRRSERVEYKVGLDAVVRRQIVAWKLPDSLLVDVHLRLSDELPLS